MHKPLWIPYADCEGDLLTQKMYMIPVNMSTNLNKNQHWLKSHIKYNSLEYHDKKWIDDIQILK